MQEFINYDDTAAGQLSIMWDQSRLASEARIQQMQVDYATEMEARRVAALAEIQRQAVEAQAAIDAAAAQAAIVQKDNNYVPNLYGAPATTPAPAAANTAVVEPKVGTEEFLNSQPVLTEHLAKQTRYPWVRTAKDFLALPTEKRQELIDDSIAEDGKRYNWTADETKKTTEARKKYLTYGDFKDNKPPSWNVVNNDFIDKADSAIDAGLSKAGQYIASTDLGKAIARTSLGRGMGFQENELASFVKHQKDQEEYTKRFSEFTKDRDKFAKFNADEAKYKNTPIEISGGISNAFNDFLRNPMAVAGGIAPAVAPALALAAASGGSLPLLVGGQAVLGAGQSLIGGTSAQFEQLMALPTSDYAKDKNFIAQLAAGKPEAEAKAFAAGAIAYNLSNQATLGSIGALGGAAGAYVGGAALAAGRSLLGKGLIGFGANATVDAGLNAAQAGAEKYVGNFNIDQSGLASPKLGMAGVGEAVGQSIPGSLLMSTGGVSIGALRNRGASTPNVTPIQPGATATAPLPSLKPAAPGSSAAAPDLASAQLLKELLDGRPLPAGLEAKLNAAQVAAGKAAAQAAVGRVEAPITPVDVNGKDVPVVQPAAQLQPGLFANTDPAILAQYKAAAADGTLPVSTFDPTLLTPDVIAPVRTMAADAAAPVPFPTATMTVPAPNAPPPAPRNVADKPKKNAQREYFNSVADVELFTDPARPLSPEARAKLQDAFDALPPKKGQRIDRATVEQAGVNLLDITAPSTTARGMTHAQVISAVSNQQDVVMANTSVMPDSGLPVLAPVSGNGWQVNTPAGPIMYPTKAALLRGVATNPALSQLMPPDVLKQAANNAAVEAKSARVDEASLPDTLFAFDKSRGAQAVGEAVRQDDGTWKAKYTDHNLNEVETSAANYTDTQAWLLEQSPNVRVTVRQVGSGQKGMTERAMRTEAMALPHLDKVANMFRVMGIADSTARAAATKMLAPFQRFDASKLGRLFDLQAFAQDKYAAFNVASNRLSLRQRHDATKGDPDGAQIAASLFGSDRVRQNLARAVAERRTGGMFEKTLGDHVVGMAETKSALKKLGIGEHTSQNIGYALDALSRNDEVLKAFPTDLRGDPSNPDAARFAYYKDAAGGIVDLQAGVVGAVTPLGLTKIDGPDAPRQFLTELASVNADVAQGVKTLGKNIADINQRVRDLMLTHGGLATTEYENLGQRPFYVPLREIENTTKTARIRATGRHTSAQYPLDQLIIHAYKHSDASFHKLIVKEFGEMLKQYPMTDIATINSAEKKLRPAQGDAESDHIWGTDNRFGKDAVSYVVGDDEFVISLKDKRFTDMLRPGELSPYYRDVVLPTAQLIQKAWTIPRTGIDPGHLIKTLSGWDVSLVLANAQGAAGRKSDGTWFVPTTAAKTMPFKIYYNALKNLKYAGKQSVKESVKLLNKIDSGDMETDLLRAYYARNGGGITMHAESGFDVSPGLTTTRGKAELRGVSMLGKAFDGFGTGVDVLSSIGHITPTAMRMAAFEQFVRLQRDGKLPQSVAEWDAWDKTKPEEAAAAIKYSKEILGNFERMGASAGVRAIFPFFNPAMVGTFSTIPQIVSSPHGQQMILAVMGLAAANATMSMGEKDEDGKDKYFRTASVWSSGPTGGGVSYPISPELRFFHNLGTFAAAHIAYMGGDNSIDIDTVNKHMLRAVVDLAPIKPSPFEGSTWVSATGIFAWPIMQMLGENVSGQEFGAYADHGNWVADVDGLTTKATNAGVIPDFAKFTQRNSPLQVSAAQWANQATGGHIDVTPDSVKSAQQHVMGAWYGYANEYQKAYLESGGDEGEAASAAAAYVFRAFNAKHNEYAVAGNMRGAALSAVRDSLLDTGKPRVDGTAKNQDVIDIEDARKQISKVRVDGMTLPAIRRQMSTFQQRGEAGNYQVSKARETEFLKQAMLINGVTLKLLENITDD